VWDNKPVNSSHEEIKMAGGWSRDGAVQDQIDASVEDAVQQARSHLPKGESLTHCEECDAEIPLGRREAIPGVRLCVHCQQALDNENKAANLFNRRGSKDSQLH
jgi:phage/conjugal plasmid C-4 type zinc finger TraR family protein